MKTKELALFSLNKKTLKGILSMYVNPRVGKNKNEAGLLSVVCSDWTRDSEHNLKYQKFHLNIGKTNKFTLGDFKAAIRQCPEQPHLIGLL